MVGVTFSKLTLREKPSFFLRDENQRSSIIGQIHESHSPNRPLSTSGMLTAIIISMTMFPVLMALIMPSYIVQHLFRWLCVAAGQGRICQVIKYLFDGSVSKMFLVGQRFSLVTAESICMPKHLQASSVLGIGSLEGTAAELRYWYRELANLCPCRS